MYVIYKGEPFGVYKETVDEFGIVIGKGGVAHFNDKQVSVKNIVMIFEEEQKEK